MAKKNSRPEANLRSLKEQQASGDYARIFERSPDSTEIKLRNFSKYIRRQNATRFLACYEIFKKILHVKGSIVEGGVYRGNTLMSWALFSAILEPANLTRRIYGFDTFSGFPSTSLKDKNKLRKIIKGELSFSCYEELSEIIETYDANRFLGHINKVELIKGDAEKTIPKFVKDNPHLVVSLLFLDFDLYKPTKAAIEKFYPRIPRGGIIAFDELDNPIWPGETLALLENLGIGSLKIRRVGFDPYIAYAIKE
jgi:hypothetical protein